MASRVMTSLLLLLAAVSLVAWMAAGGCSDRGASGGSVDVTIEGETFRLELAVDETSRERGMMGRTDIPAGTGMLFVFPDARWRSFWMKNCLIDIDLIFLDARGSVTATHRMRVEQPRLADESERDYEARLAPYVSARPAQFAIELRSGSIDRLGIGVDDRIALDLDDLKDRAQ